MADLHSDQSVWLGWWHPAASTPPRHPRVVKVFAARDAALAWRNETLERETKWGDYRRIEEREVENDSVESDETEVDR